MKKNPVDNISDFAEIENQILTLLYQYFAVVDKFYFNVIEYMLKSINLDTSVSICS